MIYKLFPSIVMSQKLNLPLDDLITYAYNLKSHNSGVSKTNKHGWQSHHINIPILEEYFPLSIPNITR